MESFGRALILMHVIFFTVLAALGWVGFIFYEKSIVIPLIYNLLQISFGIWLRFYDEIDEIIDIVYYHKLPRIK